MPGQRKVDDKSKGIIAIPELLDLLQLKGCIVTIDAMGCQQAIAETIIKQEAGYVLALKGNQPELHRAVGDYFAALLDAKQKLTNFAYLRTVDAVHGRIEIRQHWITDDISWLPVTTGKVLWPRLRSLDVTFHEDDNRTRIDFALQNLAIVRHIALNLLQQERSTKDSLKVKRLRAAWEHDYPLKLLSI